MAVWVFSSSSARYPRLVAAARATAEFWSRMLPKVMTSVGHACAQASGSVASAAAIAEPVFPSWYAGEVVSGYGVDRPGFAVTRVSVPAGTVFRAIVAHDASSVALPELHWWSDGILGAVGLGGSAIGLSLSITRQAVPEGGLDPSAINWGIDRDAIGNPSTTSSATACLSGTGSA